MSGGDGGGGGGGRTRVTDYFMSIHYAVCHGPVDSIDMIAIDGKSIGVGGYGANATLTVNNQGLYGGYLKYGGIAGDLDILMGGPNQKATPALAARLGRTPDTCPGFRGLTTMFFYNGFGARGRKAKGFFWKSNMPSLPPVSARVTRQPVGPAGDKSGGPGGTANPSHIIYEVLSNSDWGMGYPINMLDVPSFRAAATALANEGLFLSLIWVRQDTIEAFCGEILDHIQASLGPDPRTGKIRLKLLRADYNVNTLPVVHPGNARITNIQRKLWGETANEITVSWTNPVSEKEETVTIHDDANIAIQGQVISTSRNYYGVRTAALALKLALRDLRQVAAPLLAVDVELDRTFWGLMPGDVVELRWPQEHIASMYMRVGDVDYGATANAKIKTSLVEDIFGLGEAIYEPYTPPKPGDPAPTYPPLRPGETEVPETPTPVAPEPQDPEWVNPTEPPRPLDHFVLGTVPYFVLAKTYGDEGLSNFTYPATCTFRLVSQDSEDTGTIGEWAERTDSVGNNLFELLRLLRNSYRGISITELVPGARSSFVPPTVFTGTGALTGDMLLLVDPAKPEVFELAAIEGVVTETGEWTLRRGCLDTVPGTWPAGTAVWAFDPTNAQSFDTTVRVDGQEVDYKFTPVTSSGALDVSQAATETVVLTDRPYLPYRPANVAFNGQLFGKLAPMPDEPVVITWARRNRISETGQLMVWTDADVTPEPGQTTYVALVDANGNDVFRTEGLTGTTLTVDPEVIAGLDEGAHFRVGSQREDLDSLTYWETVVSMENFRGYGKRYGKYYGD